MSERFYLNNQWKFTTEFAGAGNYNAEGVAYSYVRIPHSCVEMPVNYFDESIYQMVSGYYRELAVPEEWKGKTVLLTFDGVAHDSEVYIGTTKVGEHHCGYTAFTMDISEYVQYGETNIISVKVNSREDINVPPFGFVIDYMTYGGIYRDVYVDVKEKMYIKDAYVRSDVEFVGATDKVAKIALYTDVELSQKMEGYKVVQYIRWNGEDTYKLLGEQDCGNLDKFTISHHVEGVELWDTDHPNLYEIKTVLVSVAVETVTDVYIVRHGFRKALFKVDGFYLNNKKFKIRGLNRHQSYAYVGYAMPESMQINDADILKNELGVNAVRTSHYPQSHYFIDRCDEIGLLVFTEFPGWQHVGNAQWKLQAVENVKDMVTQYRNHSSIILWGVRINESPDDDAFYTETNGVAHKLDPYRQTGGVRAIKNSNLLEDVYTYNDFIHMGDNEGCEPKKNVTSRNDMPYLVSEYNGHMYPTKNFDCEEHRRDHALRHANVLNAVAGHEDIAGSFGWCMADYNTHKDFGSGDRICYHGVLDIFRNHKQAADIYACFNEKDTILSISSSMDIGEHPACNRGKIYIYSNANTVKMYKNGNFIKEYRPDESPYKHLPHGPLVIDDFIGDALLKNEKDIKPKQAMEITRALNKTALEGFTKLPFSVQMTMLKMMLIHHMHPSKAVELYTKYVGDWGGESTVYKFEAIKDGKVVKTIVKEPMRSLQLEAKADHTVLKEGKTYDVAAIRIRALDNNKNVLNFFNEPVTISTEGPIELIGPKVMSLKGGMGGAYIKTTGETGVATVTIETAQAESLKLQFEVCAE